MTIGFFRRAVLARAVLLMAVALSFCSTSASAAAQRPEVVHQLRIYEIFENNKQAFHERFRDHAMRIMAKYDFKILAMWETRLNGRTEFVYLLQWPDEVTLKDRWARFMADKEWADIKKRTGARHGQLVGEIEDRIMTVTDYSPTKVFQRPVQL